MTTTHRIDVRGTKITARTSRRYAVVAARFEAKHIAGYGTLVEFVRVSTTTDSLAKALGEIGKHHSVHGSEILVIDLQTGEEVVA